MTNMMKEILSHWPHGGMSAAALLLFLAVFIGSFLRAYSGKNKDKLERIAALPFEDATGGTHVAQL